MSPPPMKTSKNKRMIGRRVSPNCSTPLSTDCLSIRFHVLRRRSVSVRRRGQRIAQEQRAFGGDHFADLHAFENLPVAVARLADLDRALGEPAAVGRDP